MVHVLCIVVFLLLRFVLANRADPDEMTHYAAFYLDLHCMSKYLLVVSSLIAILPIHSSIYF